MKKMLGGILAATIVAVGARAHAAGDLMLAQSTITLRGGGKPAVVVRARWSGATALPDAHQVAATLRIAGAAGEGDSGLLALPASGWRGNATRLRYADARGRAGGIRSIVLRGGRRGGRLLIVGGGTAWRFAVGDMPTRVALVLDLGTRRWCTQFDAADLKRRANRVRGHRDAPAPACPCAGNADGTFAALQDLFDRHGCTAVACHGAAPGSGGLDLTRDVAWQHLVNAPSTAEPGTLRVRPGAPQMSLLWRKLAAATQGLTGVAGSPMPSGGAPLAADELAAVTKWIYAGAPATSVVAGTEALLDACLPPAVPQKIAPPDPPAPGTGVQFYGPPWTIAPQSEGEVCYARWYDVTAEVPAEAVIDCPADWGGTPQGCFAFDQQALTQDPNSHHSILRLYRGAYGVDDPGWGTWTCHGGDRDGTPCRPLGIGTPAPAGADCGERSACAGTAVHAIGCVGYGPADFSQGFRIDDSNAAPQILISTTPYFERRFPDGVYGVLPLKGILVTNSHAFDITDEPTTNEQWLNVYFAPPADRQHRLRDLFDAGDIFVAHVPPYTQRTYCRTHTFAQGTHLFRLTSHTHKHGIRFDVWGPGIPNACVATDPACTPPGGTPVLVTTDYSDPAQTLIDPPLALNDPDPATRRYEFCARYDNGIETPVRRRSRSAPTSAPCPPGELACIGGSADRAHCSTDAQCGGGVCDACTVSGGATTEDEMFILMGDYFCDDGSPCDTTP